MGNSRKKPTGGLGVVARRYCIGALEHGPRANLSLHFDDDDPSSFFALLADVKPSWLSSVAFMFYDAGYFARTSVSRLHEDP